MADTRTTTESEQRRVAGVEPHEHVEVYETSSPNSTQYQEQLNRAGTINGQNLQDDAGFGNADLRNARVVGGDAEPTDFRTTDLRGSELNATEIGATRTDIDTPGQGTNWGTILMVIAIILVLILLGSWLF